MSSTKVSRRRLITTSGAFAAGGWLLARFPTFARAASAVVAPDAPFEPAGLTTRAGGHKPVFLAPQGTSDLAVLSYAENLFWCDIMMEHARFANLFLAGPEHANRRAQAAQYEGLFAGQLAKLHAPSAPAAHARLAAESIDLTKSFIDFKHDLHEQARTAKIRTLAYPSFWAHVAQEAERFVTRLGLLSQGQPQLDRSEVIGFWAAILEDHLATTAQMLDPDEKTLAESARHTAARFARYEKDRPDAADPVLALVEETIDWTATTEAGIDSGHIHSIITPALADHHRREAIKAADELRRVTTVQAHR